MPYIHPQGQLTKLLPRPALLRPALLPTYLPAACQSFQILLSQLSTKCLQGPVAQLLTVDLPPPPEPQGPGVTAGLSPHRDPRMQLCSDT